MDADRKVLGLAPPGLDDAEIEQVLMRASPNTLVSGASQQALWRSSPTDRRAPLAERRSFVDRCVAGDSAPGGFREFLASHSVEASTDEQLLLGLDDAEYAAWRAAADPERTAFLQSVVVRRRHTTKPTPTRSRRSPSRVGTNGRPSADRKAPIQSVARALTILEILERQGWMGVTSLAAELDIHKSTAFRLVTTLQQHGLVEQHLETQKYRLGSALVRLAGAAHAELDMTHAARPVCERLSEQTGETVNLAVLKGGEVVNIYQVNRSSSVVSIDWLGRRTGLHVTSTGKVFLAWLPKRIRENVLWNGLERMTDRTVADPDALRAELETVRRRGWASTEEELELGLNSVAAPVHGADGSVLSAICVSGPVFRLTHDRLNDVAWLTADAARQICRRIGATESDEGDAPAMAHHWRR